MALANLFFQWTIIAAAFGAGIQNLTVAIMFLLVCRSGRQPLSLRLHWATYGLFLASTALSGIVQRPQDTGPILEWCLGMSSPLVLAWYVRENLPLVSSSWRNIALATGAIVALAAGVQLVFGLQRQGLHWFWGEHRGYGFYSHPLTLAYVALPLWTLALFQRPHFPARWQQWAWLAITSTLLVASLSRIALLLAMIFASLRFLTSPLRPVVKVVASCGTVLCLATVLLTPNPVSKKFHDTIEGKAGRFAHSYADDRILFWEVHWRMWQDSPWFGTGAKAPHSIRNAVYRDLGFDETFIKRYNAHQQYLQIAADGGALALLFFGMWLAVIVRSCWRSSERWACLSCFGLLALAMGTQNALQDNEVRYLIGWLLGCLFFSEQSRSNSSPSTMA